MQPTLRELYDLGPDDAIIHKLWPASTHPLDLRCYNYATMVRRGYIVPGTALRPHSTLGLFSPSSLIREYAPYTPKSLHKAILNDGFHHIPTERSAPPPLPPEDHFLIAAHMKLGATTTNPSRRLTPEEALDDIHFFRHHPRHGYSYKWGWESVLFEDYAGNPITDPRTAIFPGNIRFIGFYHAPLSGLPGHTSTDFIDKPER